MADPAVYPDLLQMPYANEERWQALLGESLAPGKQDLLLVAEVNGDLVNHVAKQVGGKGGGKPDLAMAGGTEPAKLAQALASVPGWVAERA